MTSAGEASGADRAVPAAPATPPPRICAALTDGRELRREALVKSIDAGLGFWLRGVDVEPHREGGRFRGWRVRRLHPDDPCFASVDVRPGDVVLRVNGRALERPEHAHEIWESLRTARALTVDLVRDKKAHTFALPVVEGRDHPPRAPAPPAPAPPRP